MKKNDLFKHVSTSEHYWVWMSLPENKNKSAEEIWNTCPRGDWMLRLAAEKKVNSSLITLAACDCARLGLEFAGEQSESFRSCLEIAEGYARGDKSRESVSQARAALRVTPENGDFLSVRLFLAAGWASRAVYYAATTCLQEMTPEIASDAAISVGAAVYIASRDNYSSVAATRKDEMLAKCANVIRIQISWDDIEAVLEQKKTVAMTKITETLIRLGACAKPLAWLALPENEGNSAQNLWETCHRGDWLLWLAAKAGVNRNLVTLAACDCARLALPYVPDGEDRPRLCIETTEAFTRGEATREQVRAASEAAYNTNVYAAYAAYSAARSANYYTVHAASNAVNAAADAAARVAVNAARSKTLAECARLVRARIPRDLIETKMELKTTDL